MNTHKRLNPNDRSSGEETVHSRVGRIRDDQIETAAGVWIVRLRRARVGFPYWDIYMVNQITGEHARTAGGIGDTPPVDDFWVQFAPPHPPTHDIEGRRIHPRFGHLALSAVEFHLGTNEESRQEPVA